MDQIIIIFIAGFLSLVIGCVIGYYVRQSIAKQRAGSLEAKLQKKVLQVKEETTELIKKSEAKASDIIEKAQKDTDERRREFLKAQQVLLDREKLLETKVETFDKKETELQDKTEKLKSTKDELDKLRTEAEIKLEKVASLSREDAKKELLTLVEIDSQKDILERIKKMEESGKDTLDIKRQKY
ncbi:MAG: phosphodiesterase [Parcubacteria group bacterium GW2011_GWA2_33_14]|nr:MAG: phosphodiesterase [Parcubacteria group bacterium GW2011_GWA2_33_14]